MPQTRSGALALLTVSTMLLAAPVAAGYNSVATGGGDSWGVHDGAAPGLDTGSIRDTTGNALRGYGGIRVRVAGALTGRAAVMNGELMRGFGLRYDGYDRFRTTQAVQLGAVSITRAIRIQRNDRWARWYDTFTNNTTQSTTVEVVFGGQTGYNTGENQTEIVATSSGDASATTDDAWVAVASPTTAAGAPSQNGPSAVVNGTPGTGVSVANFLRDPFTQPLPVTGHEANHQGYVHRFQLAAGETKSLARFVAIGTGERQGTGSAADNARPAAGTEVNAVRNVATSLAAAPALADLSTAELCTLVNWSRATLAAAVPGFDPNVCTGVVKLDPPAAPQPTKLVTSSPYDVVGKTIEQMQADMASGKTTSAEITRAYLDRIAAYDTGQFGFHSLTWVAADAMDQARAADAARAAGKTSPLLGIPVAVKDLYDTKDMPTTNGSQVFEGFRPTKDAFQVRKMREAGAVILGKATMAEYANSGYFSDSAWGQVWNAFEPSKSSIGSSGGSAVATALSLASFAMGSQTGDSLWGPSSGASLYSLRGTDGMQSLTGAMPLTWLQDYAGAITRSVTDLADVLNVVSGTDPEDFLTAEADARRPADWRTALDPNALQGKRIGYYPPTFVDPFGTTGTSTAMLKALKDTVTAAGGTAVEIGAPPSSPPGAGGDRGYEGWARWVEAHPESPYKEAAEIITSQKRLPYSRRGPYTGTGRMTQTQIDGTLAQRAEYKRRLGAWMDTYGVDAVAYAGLLSDVALNDGQTPSFGRVDPQSSASGVPSVIFPAGRNDHGEPINLQLQGKAWDDAKLLGMAYAFDRIAKGHVLPDTVPKLAYEPGVAPKPIVIEKPFEPETVTPKPDADTNTVAAPALAASVAPKLTITLVSAASVRGGRARLVLRNTGPTAISGRVTLKAKVRGRTVTFGSANVHLPAGAKRTITVKLGPTAKRAIKGRTRYSATAMFTLRAGSATASLSRRVSLRTA